MSKSYRKVRNHLPLVLLHFITYNPSILQPSPLLLPTPRTHCALSLPIGIQMFLVHFKNHLFCYIFPFPCSPSPLWNARLHLYTRQLVFLGALTDNKI